MANEEIRREVREHAAEIEACNQRGGRMLSVVDLVEAGTLTPALAAYAWAAIGSGASFVVGAMPSGAGKTTVMGALLNFVPPGTRLCTADGIAAIRHGLGHPEPRRCYICHEISDAPYYGYLWGRDLRAWFELAEVGHLLASNLHADSFLEAHEQICGENAVPEEAFRRLNLLFFLSIGHEGEGLDRRIVEVWESDGRGAHRCVYEFHDAEGRDPAAGSLLVDPAEAAEARRDLDELLGSGLRTIEEVRAFVLDRRRPDS